MDLPDPPPPAEGSGGPGIEAAVASLAAIEQELHLVQQALDQLDAGTYGTCEVCAEPIDDQRLAADPVASRCAAHAHDHAHDAPPAGSPLPPPGTPLPPPGTPG